MQSLPFNKPGNWYRGNLHTHSNRSDGRKSPAQVCAIYRKLGYDFISLTDHFLECYKYPITDTTAERREDFTTILGAELHAPKTSLGDLWHIVAVGLPPSFAATGPKETGPQLAARARRAGAYVAVAHPAWYDLTDDDVLSIKAANAIEIVNMTCMELNGKGDGTGYLDRLLAQGHRYHAIACDDAHFADDRHDCGGCWVMVRARHLEPQALLDALHAGHFYSSEGPQILDMKYRAKRGTLEIHTSPARAFRLSSRGCPADYFNAPKDQTRVELNLKAINQPYARLTLIDRRGRRAWSNPFWL
jgi:histidinol phosphatase-like PHP family hydrolase